LDLPVDDAGQADETADADTADADTVVRLVPYPVVDTETHLFVRCWPAETNVNVSRVDPFTRTEHAGDLLIAEMDRVGVDVAVVIGYDGYDFESFMIRHGSDPAEFMGGRAYAAAWTRRYPDRLRYVTTLFDWRRVKLAYDLLERELSGGACGVKIFPAYLNVAPDVAEVRHAVEIVQAAGGAVIFGFEDTLPPDTPSLAQMFAALAELATDYGDVAFQLNHGGNTDPFSSDAEILSDVVRACPNVVLSTSVLGGVLMDWTDAWRYPFPNYLRRLERYAELFPPENLAWGTDWPWFEGVLKYPQLLQAIVDHTPFFTNAARRQYLGGNAFRYLGLDADSASG
jgi:predicted TIM-barrel fold metal-dependent hydrolase